jgi:hypothetical protein
MAGAPIGNKNAAKAKEFETALRRALCQYEKGEVEAGHALRKIADKLVDLALDGSPWAIQMVSDRLDGKPQASVTQDVNVNHTGTIEHRSVSEISQRVTDLLGAGAAGDNAATLPH